MSRTYSHNSLSMFRTCPRKFKFQYIEKPEVFRAPTADLFLGNVIHRVLERLYKLAADGVVMPLEDVLSMYAAGWEKPDRNTIRVSKEQLGVDDYIDNGRRMLERFYARYHPFDQGILLGAEMNIRFVLPGTPFKLMAKIDRLYKRDDGTVEIGDYKTGSSLPQGGTDPRFMEQMGLYQLAVQEKFPQFERIELAQIFLKLDEVISYSARPDEIDELAERIRCDILEIMQAEKLDNFPTQESGLCNYCDYFKLCPAKRHRLILETEEGADNGEMATMETAARLAAEYIELDDRMKQLKAEHEALKEDVVRVAGELGLEKLSADTGDVTVKQTRGEKFITKSSDADRFADLVNLARQMQLDDYFTLDARGLMKDVYAKRRLPEEQMEKLGEFVVEDVSSRVSVRHKRQETEEE